MPDDRQPDKYIERLTSGQRATLYLKISKQSKETSNTLDTLNSQNY